MDNAEIDYLKELVRFKTVSAEPANKAEMKKCTQYLAGFFRSKNLFVEIKEYKGYPSLIATTRKTKSPKLFLQAHLDVVPAKDSMFKLIEKDGKLFGRGAYDMKFACASYMKLCDLLVNDINKYDFGIMLTFDEEVGGANGVEALLKEGYSCEAAVVPDAGSNWKINNEAKGAWFVAFASKGKSAHGSMPQEGINAAENLTKAIDEIKQLAQAYKNDELTITLTKLNSGKAMNQVPDYAEAAFDIRYRNKKILAEVTAQLNILAKKYQLKRTTKMFGECLNVPLDHPRVKEFIAIAEKILNKKIKTEFCPGSTDARFFSARNIPAILMQPDGGNRHADDEWIDKAGLFKLTEILHSYIKSA